MKLPLLALACALVLPLAACGSSDSEGAGEGPVSAGTLSGTIDGAAFEGKVALADAFEFDGGEHFIEIYDADVTCDDLSAAGLTSILMSAPLEDGYAADLSFGGQSATFVVRPNGEGDIQNLIATDGRLEIPKAPKSPTEDGELRLRATYKDSQVEGSVPLRLCE